MTQLPKLFNSMKHFMILVLLLIAGNLFAIQETQEPNWFGLSMGFLGGLALFLYGLNKLTEGLSRFAGKKLKNVLSLLSGNKFVGMGVGAFVTSVIQSSSATTVMLVSFVQSGLMTFPQTLGVILGADIGTTITAQIIAFKVTDYALLMIAVGFAFRLFNSQDSLKSFGDVIFGLGLVFYGMKMMSSAMEPLRDYPIFIDLVKNLENPVYSILVGMIFTALIQSSSAFTGIIIVLAQQNLVTLEAGIPLLIGANIGTCITAALASIGTGRSAKRVAIAHVLFKVGGALLFVFWIPSFAKMIQAIGDYFGSNPARDIANAHTIFNVFLALAFLPFTDAFAKVMVKILPERKIDIKLIPIIKHLDNNVLSNPAVALDLAKLEIKSMLKLLAKMFDAVLVPFVKQEIPNDESYIHLSLIEGLNLREKKIDFLEEEITKYLVKVAKQELNNQQTNEIFGLLSIINEIEKIADIIYDILIPLISKKQDLESDFSDEGRDDLIRFHTKIAKQMTRLIDAFESKDIDKAVNILKKSAKYFELEEEFKSKHFLRLYISQKSMETHKIHMELMDLFNQVRIYLEDITKTFIEVNDSLKSLY